MNLVQFLENPRKHAAELGQALLTLFDRCLCECIFRRMKNGTLVFPVVMHKNGALTH